MLKFNSIYIKIKLFCYKFIGKIKNNINKIEVKEKSLEPQNILIIFPVREHAFQSALYTFRNLVQHENSNYYYLINRVYNNHFHLHGNTHYLNYFSKKNKIYFDETFLEINDISNAFDMVIDLNEFFNYDVALFLNSLNAQYKIGLKKEFSDWFYNLQFDLTNSEILEDGYKKIKLIIS